MEAGTDELIGGQPGQGFEPFGEVVGIEERGQVLPELGMVVVMISAHGSFLDGAVHAFDLAVGPRMVGLGEAVLDAVAPTGSVERMSPQPGGNPLTVLGQIGKLDAVVGEHRMDAIRNGLDQNA